MKRIGIVSDSHGRTACLEQMVKEAGNIDLWIHAGDIGKDKAFLEEFSGVPVVIVRGNNDYEPPFYELEKEWTVDNIRIYLCHGHQWRAPMRERSLEYKASECGADLVIYGHTHVQKSWQYEQSWIINPGSIARPRDYYDGSYSVVLCDRGKIQGIQEYRLNGTCKRIL